MNDLESVGIAIRKKRHEVNLSQEDLAGIAEVDRSYLSGIENGRRRISLEAFIKISRSLETQPWILLKDALQD